MVGTVQVTTAVIIDVFISQGFGHSKFWWLFGERGPEGNESSGQGRLVKHKVIFVRQRELSGNGIYHNNLGFDDLLTVGAAQ